MPDKTLKHDDKGNFDELKHDAIDPSDIIDDPADSRNGKPRFLIWIHLYGDDGEDYWEAKGKDGKVYKIVSDEPPKPKKKGKIIIE